MPTAPRAPDGPADRHRAHPAALREPPSTLVGHALDTDVEPLRLTSSLEDVARHLATYNLVAAPVVDDDGRLSAR